MFIDVPTAKVIATFPEGYKYQMFHHGDNTLLIVGFKDQEVIGFIYDGKEAKRIVFESDDPITEDIKICEFEYNWEGFSTRTVNSLKTEGIDTINKLLSWCDHQLLKIPNFGKKSLKEVKTKLAHKNLTIGMLPCLRSENMDSKCYFCKKRSPCN